MTIQSRIFDALRDTRITTGTAYHILMLLGLHADEAGNIGTTETGRLASEPEVIAAALGVSKDSVYKAFRRLEACGYLAWDRARGNERAEGVTGRVRILVSA
jgi:hypothetical protein